MLNKLASNSGIQELENEIAAFKKNELSDENLDNYFKPYINRIGEKIQKQNISGQPQTRWRI